MNAIATGTTFRDFGSPAAGRMATPTFVVVTTLIVTVAFFLPIKSSWTISVDQNYALMFVDYDLSAEAQDNWERPFALLMLGVFGLAALCWPDDRSMRVDGALAAVWIAFIAWCALSTFWADRPGFAVMRVGADLCGVFAGLGIAKRVSLRQFVWIVFASTLSWLALGFLAELSLGTFRPWEEDHRFAGIFHPNGMGQVCALLVLSSAFLARREPRHRRLLWAIAAVACVFLYFTRSRTALGSLVVTAMAVSLLFTPSRKALVGLMIGICAAAVVTIVIGSDVTRTAADAAALGREESEVSSLTGRVPLWQELLPFIADRPWSGYSYGFWTEDREFSEPAQSAHSTYLDTLLAFGFIGFALYLSGMLLALARAWWLSLSSAGLDWSFAAMMLVFALVCGVAETALGFTQLSSFLAICAIGFLALRDDATAPAPDAESLELRAQPLFIRGLTTR